MVRRTAFEILRSHSATPMRDIESAAERAELDVRDRSLLRRLVGTEVRRRGTLRALVRHFAVGKPDVDLAAHLHLGFVQLFFLDQIPDHAAVSETVSAVAATLGEKKARFTNAVMRTAIRARQHGTCGDPRRDLPLRELHLDMPVFHDPAEHPLLWAEDALSMPVTLMRRWLKRYGEERAFELAFGALEEPDLSLRIAASADRDATVGELAALGIAVRTTNHPRIVLAPAASTGQIVHAAPFVEGRITVQGETALRAAELVAAHSGERVLDRCAAPGGKTAVLAESGASVVACDVDAARLESVAQTLARLSLRERVELFTIDRQIAAEDALERENFDAVLVDAPCSNTGVLAQRPEARWRFDARSQASLAVLQTQLLERSAACVVPGGRLGVFDVQHRARRERTAHRGVPGRASRIRARGRYPSAPRSAQRRRPDRRRLCGALAPSCAECERLTRSPNDSHRPRRALVTGASSGIGAAIARELAREGYRVALLARRGAQLRAIARELDGGEERGHLVLVCDLRDPEQIDACLRELGRAFGGLDLLVNNAGMGYRARVEELDPALVHQVFDTNVIGLLLCCRAALPLLRHGVAPVVVNVASVVGRRGIPGQAAYAASKAAVISIGEALRVEWSAEGIAVCTLNPGLTATGFFEAQPNPSGLADPDLAQSAGPREVARVVLALDRHPRAEVSLRGKWHLLALLSLVAPRVADRLLVRRLGWTHTRTARE